MPNYPPNTMLEATESFVCDLDGERILVQAPSTRIAAEHPLAKAYPERFRPLELTYGTEEATAEPGRRSRPERVQAKEREVSEEEPSEKVEAVPSPTKGLTTESLRKSK